jgi:hypothetical protein
VKCTRTVAIMHNAIIERVISSYVRPGPGNKEIEFGNCTCKMLPQREALQSSEFTFTAYSVTVTVTKPSMNRIFCRAE